ncbi:polyhydroxyalkanoate depolymerase [Hyphococcus sp.]|uniref:polyhydroxyalkanoate depolymerase n=1 Tax=Hyphococcus sp. TaxID=2038636 RepID=UPI00208C7835|nr:MAG: esterase [Marinicaulis sp.]
MLYSAYELAYAAIAPARIAAGVGAKMWRSPLNPAAESWFGRSAAAALDVFENAMRRYPKPEWGLEATEVNGVEIPIEIEAAVKEDFCTLLHFARDKGALKKAKGSAEPDPKVLIVAPLSGHFATLLRGTVEAMLPEHDIYVTDWADARHVPLTAGRFDLNDYIDYLISFMRAIGPGMHAMAVCQPGPALLSAAAIMAEMDDPCRPASMTIMGSPIDTRRSPTLPNKLSEERPYQWFEQNMIYTVPVPYAGVMRRVYPGFVQLYSFLSMNSDRHVNAQYDYYEHLVQGDGDGADKHRKFYDEYLSVLDMTEEFYLQTIREVFQEHSLAEGKAMHRGQRINPGEITDIALMTVEGENDDISGIGQTQAAHDLCVNLSDQMKTDYIQPDVGHYGVFNGSRWRSEIQPRVAKFIRMAAREAQKRPLAKLAAE